MQNSQGTSDGIIVIRLQHNCWWPVGGILIGWIMMGTSLQAQPVLRLKAWNAADTDPSASAGIPHRPIPKKRRIGRSHFLVQFAEEPGAQQVGELNRRGVAVLSYVPESALSVSMQADTDLSGLGIQWMGRLQPIQKISPELKLGSEGSTEPAPPVVVEFYSDVADSEARAIATGVGASIHDNPDLLPHDLLIEGTVDQVRQLADWDEVSYLFPASSDLVQGVPVHGCAGALTAAGPVAQEVPLVGEG